MGTYYGTSMELLQWEIQEMSGAQILVRLVLSPHLECKFYPHSPTISWVGPISPSGWENYKERIYSSIK